MKANSAQALSVTVLIVFCIALYFYWPESSEAAAAWVAAVGTIGLIWGAFRVSADERLEKLEEEVEQLNRLLAATQNISRKAVEVIDMAIDPQNHRGNMLWKNFTFGKLRTLDELRAVLSQIPVERLTTLNILQDVLEIRAALADGREVLHYANEPGVNSTWPDSKQQLQNVRNAVSNASSRIFAIPRLRVHEENHRN